MLWSPVSAEHIGTIAVAQDIPSAQFAVSESKMREALNMRLLSPTLSRLFLDHVAVAE
jgi:hypothetical protein